RSATTATPATAAEATSARFRVEELIQPAEPNGAVSAMQRARGPERKASSRLPVARVALLRHPAAGARAGVAEAVEDLAVLLGHRPVRRGGVLPGRRLVPDVEAGLLAEARGPGRVRLGLREVRREVERRRVRAVVA